jgi:putative transferase (TIGR04331 family)
VLIGSRLDLKGLVADDIILLGPWCLPLPSDKIDLQTQSRMLDCPWKNSQELLNACESISHINQEILHTFSEALNDFHDLQEPMRFWKILIGPWLYWFVNVIYDKYFRLLEANKGNCGPLLGLPENFFIIPKDTLDFAIHINHDDSYNLQLITSVAKLLDFPIVFSATHKTTLLNSHDVLFEKQKKTSLKLKTYYLIQRLFYSYADIVLYSSYHPSRFIKKLFVESKGKIVEFPYRASGEYHAKVNSQLRHSFKEHMSCSLSGQDVPTLNRVILQLATECLPICFLEGLSKLRISSKGTFGAKVPKKIASAQAWYSDEVFKFWAASCANKGTKLLGLQHGGGTYGTLAYLFYERHELEIMDEYFTWGWDDVTNHKVTPSPAQKLLDLERYSSNKNTSEDILYVGACGSRFLINFPDVPENFSVLFENQMAFLKSIPCAIREKLRIRLHYEDKIWDIKERLSRKFENLRFEAWDIPFRESIQNAKIFVCDHISTTMLEALASNIPTIIFCDPKIVLLREAAQPYFDQLRAIGILHDSGQSAAEFLKHRYNNIAQWWYSAECQSIVRSFCDTFAKKSTQPLKDWYYLLSS